MSTQSVDHLRCPSCGGKDIRHSRQGGIGDLIMKLFRRFPYRCRGCRRRFFRFTKPIPEQSAQGTASGERPKAG